MEFKTNYFKRVDFLLNEWLTKVNEIKSSKKHNDHKLVDITELYKLISHDFEAAALKAHNELNHTNRSRKYSRKNRPKWWWDNDLKELHLHQCYTYNRWKKNLGTDQEDNLRNLYYEAKKAMQERS